MYRRFSCRSYSDFGKVNFTHLGFLKVFNYVPHTYAGSQRYLANTYLMDSFNISSLLLRRCANHHSSEDAIIIRRGESWFNYRIK